MEFRRKMVLQGLVKDLIKDLQAFNGVTPKP